MTDPTAAGDPGGPATGGFGPEHLPYGVVRAGDGEAFAAVRLGDAVLDLRRLPRHGHLFELPTLDRLLAAGPVAWRDAREEIGTEAVAGALAGSARAVDEVDNVLPFTVADYVDFYASEHHATNVGRIFRPDGNALPPNWKHLPIGYHGRAGTVVVSGTPITRPAGQRRAASGAIEFGPSTRLDVEAEVGFVVGAGSSLGTPVPLTDFRQHVFGVALVNDWSARDIQAWEYVPLGPFLGKSFATSVAGWITPLAALDAAWVDPPARDVPLLPYLDDTGAAGGLDLRLEMRLNGTLVSSPPFSTMYWTPAQMLAHMTVNGASLRAGDLFASGTVSGPARDQRGCLLELTDNGARPVDLGDGSSRGFLADGDEVVITATAPAAGGGVVQLGEVRGRVVG